MRRLLVLSSLCWLLCPTPASAQGLQCKAPESFRAVYVSGFSLPNAGKLVGTPVTPVSIECDDTRIFADEITWDEKTMQARGSVLLIQPGLRVTADRAEMNRVTHFGTFYKAAGTARLTEKEIERSMFGTLEPEVSFYAEKI